MHISPILYPSSPELDLEVEHPSKDDIQVDFTPVTFENLTSAVLPLPTTAIARSPERFAPDLPNNHETCARDVCPLLGTKVQPTVSLSIDHLTSLTAKFQDMMDEAAAKICSDLGHEFGVTLNGNVRVSINDPHQSRVVMSLYQDAVCHSSVECVTPLSAIDFG